VHLKLINPGGDSKWFYLLFYSITLDGYDDYDGCDDYDDYDDCDDCDGYDGCDYCDGYDNDGCDGYDNDDG